jgi:hypothetical protein
MASLMPLLFGRSRESRIRQNYRAGSAAAPGRVQRVLGV